MAVEQPRIEKRKKTVKEKIECSPGPKHPNDADSFYKLEITK
jgi:anthranilate/para-aminobenzoate synthase component II